MTMPDHMQRAGGFNLPNTSEADSARVLEYRAAVRLQSWVRGYRVRHRYRELHRRAAVVQRHWRGYLGRRHYRRLLQVSCCRTAERMSIYFKSCQ